MSFEAESMVLCVGSNSIWMFPKIGVAPKMDGL